MLAKPELARTGMGAMGVSPAGAQSGATGGRRRRQRRRTASGTTSADEALASLVHNSEAVVQNMDKYASTTQRQPRSAQSRSRPLRTAAASFDDDPFADILRNDPFSSGGAKFDEATPKISLGAATGGRHQRKRSLPGAVEERKQARAEPAARSGKPARPAYRSAGNSPTNSVTLPTRERKAVARLGRGRQSPTSSLLYGDEGEGGVLSRGSSAGEAEAKGDQGLAADEPGGKVTSKKVLQQLMAHPEIEAFVYELQLSDNEFDDDDDDVYADMTATRAKPKPKQLQKDVTGKYKRPAYRYENPDDIDPRLVMDPKQVIRCHVKAVIATSFFAHEGQQRQARREAVRSDTKAMINLYTDILKVVMAKKLERPVVSLLEPNFVVDLAGERTRGILNLFGKKKTKNVLMKLKVRLKGILDILMDAVVANDGFPKAVLKFLRHITIDDVYFPRNYFFGCEMAAFSFDSEGATAKMRDFMVLRPGAKDPPPEWMEEHKEVLARPHPLDEQLERMRARSMLKKTSSSDEEGLAEQDFERFAKDARAREAAVLGGSRVLGDISKCEMAIGCFLLGRILIPWVVAQPWACGICVSQGSRGKHNVKVLASMLWQLFFNIYPPAFPAGGAVPSSGAKAATPAPSAKGDDDDDAKDSDDESKAPSVARNPSRTQSRSRLGMFKSRGNVVGGLMGGMVKAVAKAAGQIDSTDEEDDNVWLSERKLARLVLPLSHFDRVKERMTAFMPLLEERLRVFIRLLTLRVIVTLQDKPTKKALA